MPATVTTTEKFEKAVTPAQMKKAVDLRIKAGAIRSEFADKGAHWLLTTEWNVIGQND